MAHVGANTATVLEVAKAEDFSLFGGGDVAIVSGGAVDGVYGIAADTIVVGGFEPRDAVDTR